MLAMDTTPRFLRSIQRGTFTLVTYLIALSTGGSLFGQSNPCAAPLSDGVYNHYKQTGSVQRYSRMIDYFRSDDFEKDVKNNGWSAGITVPIYGVPVSLNGAYNANNFKQFQSRIEKLSDNQLNEALA